MMVCNARQFYRRRGGVTLLFTLMILVVLAAAVVQFQADTALHLRSEGYRRQLVECRYAAESGVILGSAIIKQKIFESSQERAQKMAIPEETKDPNELLSDLGEDPNALADLDELLKEQVPTRQPFVIDRQEFKIGRANVVVEIHDENAKFPMIWFMSQPFEGGRQARQLDGCLDLWADSVGANRDQSMQMNGLLRQLQGKVNVPAPMYIVDLTPRNANEQRSRGRRGRSGRRMTYTQRLEEAKKRHDVMGEFAELWFNEINTNKDYEDLRLSVDENEEYKLSDYLSVWGADTVNINTASTELISSVFEPMGITPAMAEQIVQRRQEQPFAGSGDIVNVLQLGDRNLSNDLSRLFVTEADTFSLHVTATLGRAQVRMQGGLYKHRGRMYNLTIISGD